MTKRMRKIAAVTAAAVMTLSLFTSCGSADDKSAEGFDLDDNGTDYIADGGTEYSMGEAEPEEITTSYWNTDEAMPELNTEEYQSYIDNDFIAVSEHPLSTFSTDVDTASFSNVRRMITNGQNIDPDAVRAEEFINYFKYDYPAPEGEDKISISTELSNCPWNKDSKLMLVGLQAKEIDTSGISSNIVFLIDVSGSMEDENKLPLVRQAFTMLSSQLGQDDRISIVTYAGSDRVVLEGESGANFDKIKSALDSLTAGGSTAGAAGINTAYEIAQEYFIEGGNNRVILATDGDLNVGLSSREELTSLIETKRDQGIFLSVLGFGMGNYKDARLEAIADNGNGNYAYIDSVDEAERVLVREFSGTMFNVAKDAKVQVEFNPKNVAYYKLVGYENRLMEDKDFEDDTKDAGDVGSGQQVTALYEIVTTDSVTEEQGGRSLKYQEDVDYPDGGTGLTNTQGTSDLDGELLTVSVRYKEPDEDTSKLIDKAVTLDSYRADMSDLGAGGDNFRLACAAAMFAKTVRGTADFTQQDIYAVLNGCSLDWSELENVMTGYYDR